jgi:hypothetical protein
MTLELLLNELCDLGIRHNLVNYAAAGGSIYELNAETIKDYPFFFFSPTDDIRVEKNFTTYGLTVFYCDRLLFDNMNDTQVYSVATLAITNLLRQAKMLNGIVSVGDPTIRVFSSTEKMADKLNGAYARVNIKTLNAANCAVIYDETGEPMGTYVPDVIKDQSVLDSLASKAWVKKYVKDNGGGGSSGGTTPQEVQTMIDDSLKPYTKTRKFATINGSGITDNEEYDLLERDYFNEFLSAYTQEVLDIYSSISAATPEDYTELRTQVSANTENIGTLSGAVEDKQDRLTPGDHISISGNTISATGFVGSDSVSTLWSGTLQEYEAITTKDPNTLYIITTV